jgi:hypothetical protein
MEKPYRVAQIYGYTVCLVAVITFLISVSTLVNAIMNLGDPLHAGTSYASQMAPSLASFENYKMDILRAPQKEGETQKATYIPDDQTLRTMYEAAKSDKIQFAQHEANRSIIVDSLLIIICVALFGTHWRWMRKLARVETQ